MIDQFERKPSAPVRFDHCVEDGKTFARPCGFVMNDRHKIAWHVEAFDCAGQRKAPERVQRDGLLDPQIVSCFCQPLADAMLAQLHAGHRRDRAGVVEFASVDDHSLPPVGIGIQWVTFVIGFP